MATAVWSVPARLTSAIAALLSKQVSRDEAPNDRRQVLEEQLRAFSGSENSLVEVDVDLDTAKDLFDILCGLCLELDTENALHENELVILEGDCLVLQKKVAVLQSQLRRRGPDHQGPDGNGLIHYTTEEHISESGKIKTVISATPVLPYEEPTAPGLDTTTAFPQSSSQPDAHGNNPQSYRAPSPPPKAATPPFDTTSSSQTLHSDSISTPQVGSVLLSESTNSQAPRRSSKCPPPTEPLGASPTNARKRRRTPSILSSYSTSSTGSRRGRSTSRSSVSEMSISTRRSRRSSPGEDPRRSRSRSMAGRGRSARPRLHSLRARSTSRRFRPNGDSNYRERQSSNHRGGTRRSHRRGWSRSPPAKRMKTGRDYRHRRAVDTLGVGLSRHRSRRSSRSPSLEQRLRYPLSPAPLYRRRTERSPSPLRGRSSATGSRYDDDRDDQYGRRRSRDQSSTLRHRDNYDHHRGRSPRHLDPSRLPSRPTSELPRLPHARSGERSGAGQWERVKNLPPRSDGKAGKHIVWVRKDHLLALGAEQGARPVSDALLPPTSPRDRRLAPPPQEVISMNQGPESPGGLVRFGPHWGFHKRPRNSDGYRGLGNYESNRVREANQSSSFRPPHPPPSRPLADRVSSSKGPEGPTRQSPPSLAARISPIRPMRSLQVSHGLLQRSPLKFANGRLGREDNGPPKATGANQVPVSNLNSRITGIPVGSSGKSAETGGHAG